MMMSPASARTATRTALGAGVIAPILLACSVASPAAESLVGQLVARAERQAQLFNKGEMVRWLEVADPADDFTLLQPFGGPASKGFDRSPEHLAEVGAQFRNGDAAIELVQAISSDDLVVLVYIERQQIEVSGLPLQDWSLRVTQVFQRQGNAWKLMHRHADPLVRPVGLATAAALAGGRALASAPVQRGQ